MPVEHDAGDNEHCCYRHHLRECFRGHLPFGFHHALLPRPGHESSLPVKAWMALFGFLLGTPRDEYSLFRVPTQRISTVSKSPSIEAAIWLARSRFVHAGGSFWELALSTAACGRVAVRRRPAQRDRAPPGANHSWRRRWRRDGPVLAMAIPGPIRPTQRLIAPLPQGIIRPPKIIKTPKSPR